MQKQVGNYIKFLISLVVMGFGIAVVTKSNLGTSAVSSLSYVLSNVFSLSFGTFTFLVNMLFFLIQLLILRKDFPKQQYFQVVVGPILGLFVDLSMYVLRFVSFDVYVIQMIALLVGCIIIGSSIHLQLEADVVVNPTEGIIKLLSAKTNVEFSSMKTYVDIFLVIVSVIISYVGLNKIVGVREGTLISAFFVGYVIKVINKLRKD